MKIISPLSKISDTKHNLNYESYYAKPFSLTSDEEVFPEDGLLSCYGTMAEHIEINLKSADVINPHYYNSKIHAISIDTEVDVTSLGVHIKHLIINHILPLKVQSMPCEILNSSLKRRSVHGI